MLELSAKAADGHPGAGQRQVAPPTVGGMVLHPLWLVLVTLIIGPPIAVVALIVALAGGARRKPAGYGTRSPDGRWWWDGSRWQPVPTDPRATPGTSDR
jgi:hypothetical protein